MLLSWFYYHTLHVELIPYSKLNAIILHNWSCITFLYVFVSFLLTILVCACIVGWNIDKKLRTVPIRLKTIRLDDALFFSIKG